MMHEQLYLTERSPVRYCFFLLGIVIFPAAFLNFYVVGGIPLPSFRFDLPTLLLSLSLSALFFLPIRERMRWLILPYGVVLLIEFLRFGTVTIFDREIPFPRYIASAAMMLAAFAYTFFVYFIAEGKIRSKLPLFFAPALFSALCIASLFVPFAPFGVLSEITEGEMTLCVSDAAVFLVFALSAFFLGLFLKSDKVKAEKTERKRSGER